MRQGRGGHEHKNPRGETWDCILERRGGVAKRKGKDMRESNLAETFPKSIQERVLVEGRRGRLSREEKRKRTFKRKRERGSSLALRLLAKEQRGETNPAELKSKEKGEIQLTPPKNP